MTKENILKIPAFQRKQMLEVETKSMTHLYIPQMKSKKPKKVREMKACGTCQGLINDQNVAIILATSPIRQGDTIIFETADGLFEQKVEDMLIGGNKVKLAKSGNEAQVEVELKPKIGGSIYKVI